MYKDKIYTHPKRPRRRYKVCGEFTGYDGIEYVALQKIGFNDKSWVKKSYFDSNYVEVQGNV